MHDNDWYGVWVDNGSENITISNNRIHHNTKKGVQFEISGRGAVYGNVVWENAGRRHTPDRFPGRRSLRQYSGLEPEGGIFVLNGDRAHGHGFEYDQVRNVRVHHNTVLMDYLPSIQNYALDWRKSYASGNICNPDAGNRGYDNRYWYEMAETSRHYRFHWDNNFEKVGGFNTTLGEERGRYLTDAEERRVALSKGIPSLP